MLIRWNDDPAKPLGNPVSHGHPTWFVLPLEFHDEALKHASKEDPVRAQRAADWLNHHGSEHWPYDPDEYPDNLCF